MPVDKAVNKSVDNFFAILKSSLKQFFNELFAMSPYLENGKFDFDLLDIIRIMRILSL